MSKKPIWESLGIIPSSYDKTASGANVRQVTFNEKEVKNEIENLKNSLDKTKGDFENFKKEQNIKLIEFLGIFTAILAFITISSKIVIDNLTVLNVMLLLPTFALIMLIFILGINALITKENNKLFYALIFIFVALDVVVIIVSIHYGWLK